MRPLALLLAALCLAACSSDPSPTPGLDAQAADAADVVSELAPDVAVDVPRDTGPALDVLDAAVDAAPDVVTDATPEAAADVADAAVGDASPPADGDGGAGPVTYDLNRSYTAPEFHVLYTATCASGECAPGVVESVSGAPDCYVTGGQVHFSIDPIIGAVSLAGDAGPGGGTVSFGALSTVGPVLTAGRAYVASGPRQNFRVQFAVMATTGRHGVAGVPGRTASPDMGDVWLLGCPVR